MPKNYFSNHDVFWKAVKTSKTYFEWADDVQKKLGKNPEIDYDHRDLYTLALLTVDLSNIPEEQHESYFKAEYEKIHAAFDVSDPNNIKRSDPQKVKPYIKKMFECVLTDLSTLDYNDPKDVQKVIHTMLATQMLSIKIKDYPDVAMELYPTHEDKARIDAITAKALAVQLEARVQMSYEGLDEIGKYFMTIGGVTQKNTGQLLKAELIHKMFDTNLPRNAPVMLDPTANELSTKFFMNESFVVEDDIGVGPEEFTEYNYGKYYVEQLSDCIMNTSFEYQTFVPACENSTVLGNQDLLIINGKPLGKILEKYRAQGYRGPEVGMMAGQHLREALLKGEPVTVITSSVSKDGEIRFNNKDIKLDLDKLDIAKLNQQHYDSYHPFRKWLDRIGLIPIRLPYLNNEQRDAKQAKIAADPKSAHQKQIKAIENEYIRAYNSIDRETKSLKGCAKVITSLTRVEAEIKTPETTVNVEITKSADVAKDKDIVRENINMKEFNEPQNVETEPQKTNGEKVSGINSAIR